LAISEVKIGLFAMCLKFNAKKVVVKILQGSVVTKTMLGGLTIHPRVANFLRCICAKNYENWLTVDKVIAKIVGLPCFGPPCILWANIMMIMMMMKAVARSFVF